MEVYGFKRKKKRWWLIPTIAAGIVLLIIYTVGIIVNITGASHKRIDSAVSENSALKQQVEALNAEIESLNAQIESLRAELERAPKVSVSPQPESHPQTEIMDTSPRNNDY